MRTPEKFDESNTLLNAVLADSDWEAVHSSLKREAVAAMAVAARRRVQFRMTMAACAALLLAATTVWLSPSFRKQPLPVASQSGLLRATSHRFVSEEEMLAMFPLHSCVIAEVDGAKRLVFFDPAKAADGFPVIER